jgi:hypothetical protein
LRALEPTADDVVDTGDIPANPDWSGAVHAKFHRLGAMAGHAAARRASGGFLRGAGQGYRSQINDALRERVTTHMTVGPGKSG